MKAKYLLTMVASLSLAACDQSPKQTSGLHLEYMDQTQKPGTDFYQYVNGGWQKLHPLPADKARFATFDMLSERASEALSTMVQELAKTQHETGTNEQKVGDMFTLVMDSVRLNAEGADPIKADLAEIAALKNPKDVYELLAKLNKRGVSAYYGLGVGTDAKNSKAHIMSLRQGSLSLGQIDYYKENDDNTVRIREAFKKHIVNMFKLAGYSDAYAEKARDVVMEVENELANNFRSRTQLRDPEANYNKMTIDEVKKLYPSVPFQKIFDIMGIQGEVNEIVVGQPEAISAAVKIIDKLSVDKQILYLQWKQISSAANNLSDAFVAESFDFNNRVMAGVQQQEPRWKRALRATEGSLGEVLGQLYVKEFFPPEAKARMVELVKSEQEALGERIKALTWMSDATKEQALAKLATFRVKIGYPDEWKDYSGLTVDPQKSYYENAKVARLWRYQEQIDKFGKPVDPTEWHMTPQTVNAYYSSTTNEICFPAGILQPPFFDMNADDAFNYGGIGVVIGHEMSHGFDDSGRQFDKDGNMSGWWSEEDNKNFKERAQVLIDFFSSIEVAPGVYGNGAMTLGENIGDHGGLKIAYTAYKNATKDNPLPDKDGFTADQRFFLAFAGVWANNITDQEILRRTKTDVHSLGRWRVNGALPQIDAWYEAFNITENDPMFIPKEKRADVW